MLQIYKVSDEITKYPVNYFDIVDYEYNVIVPSLTILNYFKDMYSMYYMKTTLDKAWYDYMQYSYDDFMSMWYAWKTEYNPLENYDMHETTTNKRNVGNITDNTTNTIDTTTSTENDNTNKPKTEHYTTTYDDTSTNRLESYDISQGKTTSTQGGTVTNNRTESHNITTLDDITAHEVEINTIRRNGNIGVTTSQQMLNSEIELRKKHIIQLHLEMFCKKYMFFVGGIDSVYSNIIS